MQMLHSWYEIALTIYTYKYIYIVVCEYILSKKRRLLFLFIFMQII